MPTLDNYSLGNYGLGGFDKDAPLELLSSGSLVSSTGSGYNVYKFDNQAQNGTTYSCYVVRSFAKVPKFIIIKRNGATEALYARDMKNSYGNSLVVFSSFYSAVMGDWYVTTSGFFLPSAGANVTFTWEAWG